jgi:hypothetical protein
MFLRNVSYLSTDYTALYTTRYKSSSWLSLGTFGSSGKIVVTLYLGLKHAEDFLSIA